MGDFMILNPTQAREIGEALLDAYDAVNKSHITQAIVTVKNSAVSVPYNDDVQDLYETVCIIQV